MTSVSFFTLWRSSRLPPTTDTAPDQRRYGAVHRRPQAPHRRPQVAPHGSPHPRRPIRRERPAATRQTCPQKCSDMHPNGRDRAARDPAHPVSPAVRDAGPVQITTLGALAVDGRPVRGDRLVALVRALARRPRPRRVVRGARRGRVGGHPARRRRRCGAGAGLPRAPARAAGRGAPGGYRLPTDGPADRRRRRRGPARPGRARPCATATRRARTARPATRAAWCPPSRTSTDTATARLLADVVDAAAPRPALALGRGRRHGRGPAPLRAADPARRAARRAAGPRARGAGPRRRGSRGGRAGARRARRPVRHRPVARRRAGAPRPAARRARARTGARADAAPPRAVLTLPAAWRRPATALVGRDDDVAAVEAALGSSRRWSPSSRPAAPARPGWRPRSPGAPRPAAGPSASSSWPACARRPRCCPRCSRRSAASDATPRART